MLHVKSPESMSTADQPPRLIPRSVWRKLLLSPPVVTSSRVLFGGEQVGGDARTLAALPIDLCVACNDDHDVMTLRRELPGVDSYSVTQALTHVPPGSVDLIVLHNTAGFDANLFDASVRKQTAGWLSMLRPQGRLVFLQRGSETFDHLPECWVRHLACFPGRIEHRETWDSLYDWSRWELFGPREHRPTTHLVSITVPNEPLLPEDWRDYARHGLLTSQRTCCANAAATVLPAIKRRAA